MVEQYSNYNLVDIVTLINADQLQQLLVQSDYDKAKTDRIVQGFCSGFDIGYRGPMDRHDTSSNIPIWVGTKGDLWSKIMKEVQLGRSAGLYENIPYQHYIQSPVRLVPKAGNQTRMIFHLSFDFGDEEHQLSLNDHIPDHLCSVQYNDLDCVVKLCLALLQVQDNRTYQECLDSQSKLFFAKADLKSAFKILPILSSQRCLLIMAVRHPMTKNSCSL